MNEPNQTLVEYSFDCQPATARILIDHWMGREARLPEDPKRAWYVLCQAADEVPMLRNLIFPEDHSDVQGRG